MLDEVAGGWKSPGILAIPVEFIACNSLSQAAFRDVGLLGGNMMAKTGSHGNCVGRWTLEISRMELFSFASTNLV